MRKTRLFVIGCTGSVGRSVLDVCRTFPDHFEVRALGARSSWEEAGRQAREFNCPQVVMAEAAAGEKLRSSGLGRKF